MWGGVDSRSRSPRSGSCPCAAACTTWHSYKTLRLQSPGETMAPFRPAVPGASQGPGCGQSTRHEAQPRPQHGGSPGPSCKGKGRRCWMLLGMFLQPTPQLLGEQPVSSSPPAASLLTMASCQHKGLSAGALVWSSAWHGGVGCLAVGTPTPVDLNSLKNKMKRNRGWGTACPFFPLQPGD